MGQEQGSYQVTAALSGEHRPQAEAGRQINTKALTGQGGVESDPPRPGGTYKYEWAVLTFASVPLVVGVLSMAKGPSPVVAASGPDTEGGQAEADPKFSGRLPRVVRRLTVYGFLLGIGAVVIVVYLPLYAEEVLGMSRGEAGLVLALTGPVGIIARIGWGRAAEGRLGMVRSLMAIAILGVMAGTGLSFGDHLGIWVVWVAAAVVGFSVFAWTSVGMLAVIEVLPASLAGRGSGAVYFGYISGFGVGAPLFGWSVDTWGTYTPGWIAITILFAAGFWTIFAVRGDGAIGRPISSDS